MPKKIAFDWDEIELRWIIGQVSGNGRVRVTDAAVVPLENTSPIEVVRSVVKEHGLNDVRALVAIGRGNAELRELKLPPVPEEELPDMVRFQAIRTFASSGDSATVDFLVTSKAESGIELIAAAIGPNKLNEIRKTCEAAGLVAGRVALRPLSAAALYLTHAGHSTTGDFVLVDLLAGDAEIVIARDGHVIFVRTVRMPTDESTRPRVLAGELRRSLVACGAGGTPERVVLWGRASVHVDDQRLLAEAANCPVELLDPFDLVDVDPKLESRLPQHVGRLAPLVGLMVADELHGDRLIDFINPRKRIDEEANPYKTAALIGVPVLVALLLGGMIFRQLGTLDAEIAELRSANAAMKPAVDAAAASSARTETIDQFLDGDVNWLDELRRLARTMPPSDKLIVRSVSGTTDVRSGGGKLVVSAAVTQPSVIDDFENAVRDDSHGIIGDGVVEEKNNDAYKFGIRETITIEPESIRNRRYERILQQLMNTPTESPGASPAVAPENKS